MSDLYANSVLCCAPELLYLEMLFEPFEEAVSKIYYFVDSLFKQVKQNFPLKYFYGENANAIKIQIWGTLITNLLLMVMQRELTRS